MSRASEIRRIAARHKGHNVAVFGSVARGDEYPGSDVDLLMDFEPGTSLFDIFHLQRDLSVLLGSGVDVIDRAALRPRDIEIRQDAVPL